MPNMANITLKNAANADVTATALTPSAGDGVAARWRVETADAPAYRPAFSVIARASNGASDVRRVQMAMGVPVTYQDLMTSSKAALGVIRGAAEFIVPQTAPTTFVDDAAAYFRSFVNSPLFVEMLKTQIAAT